MQTRQGVYGRTAASQGVQNTGKFDSSGGGLGAVVWFEAEAQRTARHRESLTGFSSGDVQCVAGGRQISMRRVLGCTVR